MNIGRIKLVCWLLVAGLSGYLGWTVYLYVTVVKKEVAAELSVEEQQELLNDVEEPEATRAELLAL